ncbi:hypothetical protein ACH4VQ_35865 [Streptomyces anulatus]
MKRRRIMLLAAVMVASSALLGSSAPALAVSMSVQPLSATGTEAMPPDGRHLADESLVSNLTILPEAFEVGGDWKEFNVVLTNVTDGPISEFGVSLEVIAAVARPPLHPSHVSVQMMSDGSWLDAEPEGRGQRDIHVELPIDDMVLSPGRATVPVRTKFSDDAPSIQFYINSRPDLEHSIGALCNWKSSQIVRPDAPHPETSADPPASAEPSIELSPSTAPAPSAEPPVSAHPLPAPDPTEEEAGPSPADGAGHTVAGGSSSDTVRPSGTGLVHTGSSTAARRAIAEGGTLIALGVALAARSLIERRRNPW